MYTTGSQTPSIFPEIDKQGFRLLLQALGLESNNVLCFREIKFLRKFGRSLVLPPKSAFFCKSSRASSVLLGKADALGQSRHSRK